MERIGNNDWHKALWRILSNPTWTVVAALAVVALATWIVVSAEVEMPRHNPYPLPYVGTHK